MKTRLHTRLAAASLILCMATIALWVRSWRGGQSIERVDPHQRIVVTSMAGVIQMTRWDGAFQPPSIVAGGAPSGPPPGAWRKWMYWHGWNGGDPGPTDWAYEPFSLGGDHWWQDAGFDAFDRQCKPSRNGSALNDWLQPQWSGRLRSVIVPYWAITIAFCMPPGITLLRFIRRTRGSRG